MEQQVMEQLVKFIEGKDGEPGYFISPLPLKPFNINSVGECWRSYNWTRQPYNK